MRACKTREHVCLMITDEHVGAERSASIVTLFSDVVDFLCGRGYVSLKSFSNGLGNLTS